MCVFLGFDLLLVLVCMENCNMEWNIEFLNVFFIVLISFFNFFFSFFCSIFLGLWVLWGLIVLLFFLGLGLIRWVCCLVIYRFFVYRRMVVYVFLVLDIECVSWEFKFEICLICFFYKWICFCIELLSWVFLVILVIWIVMIVLVKFRV